MTRLLLLTFLATICLLQCLARERNPLPPKTTVQTLLSKQKAEERDSGLIYIDLGMPEAAADYYHKALSLAITERDTAVMQFLTGQLAGAYIALQDPATALKYLTHEKTHYPPVTTNARIQMVSAFLYAYILQHRADRARPYAEELKQLLPSLDQQDAERPLILMSLLTYSLAVKRYTEAIQYGTAAEVLLRKYRLLPQMVRLYNQWYKADSALGNYNDAIKHYQQYKYYSDSMFSLAKAGQVSQLQVKMDADRKEHDLQLKEQDIALLTREAQLQTTALQKTQLTRNVIIGGVLMLAVCLFLGYNRYQLKLRSNHQLKVKQQEVREQHTSLQLLLEKQKKLLQEKEYLVQEIHHRVKDNLEIVMSLLKTQSGFLRDEAALKAISESRSRMQAIYLIHQKLYQQDSHSLVNMKSYISELIDYLKQGILPDHQIDFQLDVAPVALDVAYTVPIGLTLNEAVTNAIKYAFTDTGTIAVSLKETGRQQLTLTIADNGKGFPAVKPDNGRQSIGLMLMNVLSEQLEGELAIQHDKGVTISLSFQYGEHRA
ncbi:sensor histidine kinase [Chitinophaga agri]|uniref:histidine kinase n=1 Tax=Chitinophaga agri TaxID=2703787 RepID=A0A6B9ZFA4_9BACT|nr:histidine kinase dimerization/phosphoacceptor domain -containing protein [Chitinophaga agri]QHS61122.1 hypothetical protein GWR21_16405 [Chitinophaga agri]